LLLGFGFSSLIFRRLVAWESEVLAGEESFFGVDQSVCRREGNI
jgi:hypothetical protein